MSRKPVIWAYKGQKAGPVQELAKDGIEGMAFASEDDKSRFRRIIEDNLRKQSSDERLLAVARLLEII
jgi:hypothetical protein